MEKSETLVNTKELNKAILDLLEDLDGMEEEEIKSELSEEEKTKRKSIWDRLSH